MNNLPPFDEAAFLRRLERIENAVTTGAKFYDAELASLCHGTRRLLTELIATRQANHALRGRVAEFEQGQTLLPLSPATATNQPPRC